MNRPNIVFYFSDQQRWDTLGCYGQKLPVTPVLDHLASSGVRFSNAYTCQPVCGPARACLQTGRYAAEIGCFRNDIELPQNLNTLAQYFNQAGYETAYVGKWHLASNKEKGINHRITGVPEEYRGGYKDYWMAADVLECTSHGYNGYVFDQDNRKVEFTGYRADCINNFAIDYLHNRKTNNPFFLFISQIEPHHQNDHGRAEGPDGSKARFKHFDVPGDLQGTEGNWRENYPDYLGQCNSLDYNVGRLIDTLKEQGEWENTILIYTSDHGSHFCTRNREYKRSCHDGCTHLPLIIHGPGFEGGKVIDDMVSLIDLPVTLLDCAGIAIPESFRGGSLKRLVSGEMSEWKQHIFMQISENQISRAIRTSRWKYCVRAQGDGWTTSSADVYYEDLLYDLEADPHEKINLVGNGDYSEVCRTLAEILKQAMEDAGEQRPTILENALMPAVMRTNAPQNTSVKRG